MKLATEYPVKLVCQTLGYPCSLYYYQIKGGDEEVVRKAITEVAGRPTDTGESPLSCKERVG